MCVIFGTRASISGDDFQRIQRKEKERVYCTACNTNPNNVEVQSSPLNKSVGIKSRNMICYANHYSDHYSAVQPLTARNLYSALSPQIREILVAPHQAQQTRAESQPITCSAHKVVKTDDLSCELLLFTCSRRVIHTKSHRRPLTRPEEKRAVVSRSGGFRLA